MPTTVRQSLLSPPAIVFCAAIIIGAVGEFIAFRKSIAMTGTALLPTLPVLAITGLAIAAIIKAANPYRLPLKAPMLAAACYGALLVPWVGAIGNGYWAEVIGKIFPPSASTWLSPMVGAPLTEETAKALGVALIILTLGRRWARPMTGLLLGAATGLGFQLMENIIFAAQAGVSDVDSDSAGAMSTMLIRCTLGFATHWVLSAFAGVGVAILLSSKAFPARVGWGCIATAWALHVIENSPTGPLALLLGIIKLLVFLLAFSLLLKKVWSTERRWLTACAGESSPAIGTHKERQAARKAAGNSKELKAQWNAYLASLHALS